MANIQNGKGSRYRPVNKKVFDDNWDEIEWRTGKQPKSISFLSSLRREISLRKQKENHNDY
jgi:hypothetical protein